MKFTKRNDVLVNGIRPGFTAADSHFLNRQTHTPKTQIWSSEQLEDEDPEDRIYYCAICKGVLDYDKYLDAYACKSCVQSTSLYTHTVGYGENTITPNIRSPSQLN